MISRKFLLSPEIRARPFALLGPSDRAIDCSKRLFPLGHRKCRCDMVSMRDVLKRAFPILSKDCRGPSPAVKFSARLDLNQICRFLDVYSVSALAWRPAKNGAAGAPAADIGLDEKSPYIP
jgi:hypothetical protein